jgi:biopolymer transport protein ExbD
MIVPRKKKKKVEIPTTSTGDIAFLLIIFFMSVTKFDVKEGVKVQLNKAVPSAIESTTEIQLTEQEMTRIEITDAGLIKINNLEPRIYSDDDLDKLFLDKVKMRENLNNLSKDPKTKKTKMLFLVKTNSEAPYKDMVRVVDHLVTYRDRAMISISTQI